MENDKVPPPAPFLLSWNFEQVGEDRRLAIKLSADPEEPRDMTGFKAFMWAWGGTKLDGEPLQEIDLRQIAEGSESTHSWNISKPYKQSVLISENNCIVYRKDIQPKAGLK